MIFEISVGIITICMAGYVLWQLSVKRAIVRAKLKKLSRALESKK